MAKSRDYIYTDVTDISGKKLGYIKDVLLDFNKGQVVGYKIIPYKFIGKEFSILKEHIVYHNTEVIVNSFTKKEYLDFSTIKNMYVFDVNSNFLGVVYEILFSEEDYNIKGICIKSGNFFLGFRERKILLIKELILGEKSIVYIDRKKNIECSCLPRINLKFNYRENGLE